MPLSCPAVLTLTLLLLVVLPAANASASSVSAVSHYEQPLTNKDRLVDETSVTWTAAPGERNRLLVTVEPPRTVVLRDPAAPLTVGDGCVARPDGSAACTGLQTHLRMTLDAGDGDDELRLKLGGLTSAWADGAAGDDLIEVAGDVPTLLDGGAGDDRLIGGDGTDHISGEDGDDLIAGGDGDDLLTAGRGDDRLDGGAGSDRARYVRDADVHADLRAGSVRIGGERDTLVAVERLNGGRGSDELTGTGGRDGLNAGRAGRDRLDGRGGDDVLVSHYGAELLRGGAGDDRIRGGARLVDAGPGDDRISYPAGRLRCGPGFDVVRGVEESPQLLMGGDCERIEDFYLSLGGLLRAERALRLVVREKFYRGEYCGAVAAVGRGGALGRAFVRLTPRRARTLVVRTRAPLARRFALSVGFVGCDRAGRPRLDAPQQLTRLRVEPRTGEPR